MTPDRQTSRPHEHALMRDVTLCAGSWTGQWEALRPPAALAIPGVRLCSYLIPPGVLNERPEDNAKLAIFYNIHSAYISLGGSSRPTTAWTALATASNPPLSWSAVRLGSTRYCTAVLDNAKAGQLHATSINVGIGEADASLTQTARAQRRKKGSQEGHARAPRPRWRQQAQTKACPTLQRAR